MLGLDGLTPGDGDLAFGLDFLVAGAAKHELPYVSANLAAKGGDLVFPAYRMVERGGLKIGLIGVMGEQFAFPDADVKPATPAVRDAVAAVQGEGADLVVLLSHLALSGDRAIAEAVPGIDLIFGGNDRRHQENPVLLGETAIFQAGSRAKYVGQATLELVPGGRGWADPKGRESAVRQLERTKAQVERYEKQLAEAPDEATRKRLERVLTFAKARLEGLEVPEASVGTAHQITATKIPMNRQIEDEAGMKALVDAMLETMGPEVGGGGDDHGHDHGAGGHDKSQAPPQPSGPYVTARQCRTCHPAQYKDWTSTSHAHAYATLMKEKRHFDQDCWSCHVTGAKQEGGPQTPAEAGVLRNVQCEACHGPGKAHVEKPGKGNIVKTPTEQTCLTCHTEEQTEGAFVFGEYLPKVDHR